jgi:hypothetical protein
LKEFDFIDNSDSTTLAVIKKHFGSVKHTYSLCFYPKVDLVTRQLITAAVVGFDQEADEERDNSISVATQLMICVIVFAVVVAVVLIWGCCERYRGGSFQFFD